MLTVLKLLAIVASVVSSLTAWMIGKDNQDAGEAQLEADINKLAAETADEIGKVAAQPDSPDDVDGRLHSGTF